MVLGTYHLKALLMQGRPLPLSQNPMFSQVQATSTVPNHCPQTAFSGSWTQVLGQLSSSPSYLKATILRVDGETHASLDSQDIHLPGISVCVCRLPHTILATLPQTHWLISQHFLHLLTWELLRAWMSKHSLCTSCFDNCLHCLGLSTHS